jgi:hypothetical protein
MKPNAIIQVPIYALNSIQAARNKKASTGDAAFCFLPASPGATSSFPATYTKCQPQTRAEERDQLQPDA